MVMVNNNVKIDVCEWLKDELIDNLKKIKGDKKGTFSFENELKGDNLFHKVIKRGLNLKMDLSH